MQWKAEGLGVSKDMCNLCSSASFSLRAHKLLIPTVMALRTFEQGGVNLPARVSPEALLSRIVNGMKKTNKQRFRGSMILASTQNMVLQLIYSETLAERTNRNFGNGPYNI